MEIPLYVTYGEGKPAEHNPLCAILLISKFFFQNNHKYLFGLVRQQI